MLRIAITGGIGSGKSMVATMLRVMGHPVYDCDSRAKALMDNSMPIKKVLQEEFGKDVVVGNIIDRHVLAGKVFGNEGALKKLNSIVHPAVAKDFEDWAAKQGRSVFVESAILSSSGLDAVVDRIWQVVAPEAIRIERVMARSKLSEIEVRNRIAAQAEEAKILKMSSLIINDGKTAVLPQVMALLGTL